MILKGNQRGGGQQLAAHLMNEFDNERVEVADIRDAIAQDLSGAFAEWRAQSRATKCRKYLYSASFNPDQSQGHLTREQYLDLMERTERSLKLVGQPRAVVFHEKRDKDGVPRQHCHVVWSRIDNEKMKAVQIAHDRLKLRTVAREFCRDHGLQLPEGMKRDGSRQRFNERAKQENLAERQQKERTGISKQERMADIATCWRETGNAQAFMKALETKGYFLCRGDKRTFVVVDLHSEVHSLSRQLSGVAKSKELKDRLAGLPLDQLPNIEKAQEYAKHLREERERQEQREREASEVEKRRAALKDRQQQRREDLNKKRIDLLARHLSEREDLKHMQQAEITGVTSARLARQPKGVLAFLTRITGIKMMTAARQKREDVRRAEQHKQQGEALKRRHGRELKAMDRHYGALRRVEARENKSADTALKREKFQKTLALLRKPPERALKPPFDRAAKPDQQRTGTADGRTQAPKDAAKPPVDLTEAFNREVDERLARESRDREPGGPGRRRDPDDPDRSRK